MDSLYREVMWILGKQTLPVAAFGDGEAKRELIQVVWAVASEIVSAALHGLQGVMGHPEPGYLNEQTAGQYSNAAGRDKCNHSYERSSINFVQFQEQGGPVTNMAQYGGTGAAAYGAVSNRASGIINNFHPPISPYICQYAE